MHQLLSQKNYQITDNIANFLKCATSFHARNHFIFPPLKKPSQFIERVGREFLIKTILYHYSLVRQIASKNFYQKEYRDFMDEVTKIAHFTTEVFGCNTIYTNEYGFINEKNFENLPFKLDEKMRELWLNAYVQTLKEMNFPQKDLPEFWNWLELFSLHLLNTSHIEKLPKRFYFESIKKFLSN